MARAAEFRQARVSSHARVESGIASETVQVSASACTGPVEMLGEKVDGNELAVTLRVTLADTAECRQTCATAYINRLVVTAFALEYPEQKRPTEQARLSALTAIELAKKVVRRGRLLADYDAGTYPYISPARAPQALSGPDSGESLFATLARQYRGQYVLSGVYRDLGISSAWLGLARRRAVRVEVFLHDGVNGEVLARHTFVGEVRGDVELPAQHGVGSAAFYASDFGQAWGDVLEAIAAWSEQQAACQPFMARVLKVNGSQLQIDAGAEAGLSVGDTLSLHNWRDPPVWGVSGDLLGREKSARVKAVVRTVYPRFSLVELQQPPANLIVRPGDLLYAQ
jgi:hypothetical protein